MSDHHKLTIDKLPPAITDHRPVSDLTGAELREASAAFALLVSLANESQETLINRRYTLAAAGDQLHARQRDLDAAAHPARCADRQVIADALASIHRDLAEHLAAWEKLEHDQHAIASVLDAASNRSRQILAEVASRNGGAS